MKKYVSKNRIYYILIFIIVILLGLAIGACYILNYKKGFTIENRIERIESNNYKMEINYPLFNNKKANGEINKEILMEKEKFLKEVDKDTSNDNELNINYSYSIKDNVYSVHLRTYSYTGNNNDYYRNDKIMYFDKDNNKEIEITDLIIDNDFYNTIKDECIKYLNTQDNFLLYDKEQLDEAINNKNNYELIIFSEKKIYVILAPHIVSPYDGDITIGINYEVVSGYLNKDFFTSIEENKEYGDSVDIDNTNRIRDFEQFKDKKLVALTFDDGPAYSKTETLLEEFEKRNVRATFFLLGELALKQQDIVEKMYKFGHTIGSHTYDHKNLKKLDEEQLNYEINYTNGVLSNIIGEDIKYIRPPYGAYTKEILDSTNMSFILWSVDTEDWKLRDADKVAQYMVDNISDGDIVLLHDIHQETIDGVIKGIDLLKEEGYEFVSLEELAYYRNVTLEANKVYRKIIVEDNEDIEDIVATKNIDVIDNLDSLDN